MPGRERSSKGAERTEFVACAFWYFLDAEPLTPGTQRHRHTSCYSLRASPPPRPALISFDLAQARCSTWAAALASHCSSM